MSAADSSVRCVPSGRHDASVSWPPSTIQRSNSIADVAGANSSTTRRMTACWASNVAGSFSSTALLELTGTGGTIQTTDGTPCATIDAVASRYA